MRFHAIGFGVAVTSMALALSAPAGAQTQVYALDPGGNLLGHSCQPDCHGPRLELVNASTGRSLAMISLDDIGPLATAVQASSDGTRLYVSAYSAGGGHLYVVDAIAKRVVAKINVGGNTSTDVAVLPDSSRAYVVNSNSDNVSVVDLATFTVVTTIAVQSRPSRIVAAPTGSAVYVTNFSSDTVSKISTDTNSIGATIAVGAGPTGIDISPDGSRIFVANTAARTISVIDATSDSVLRALPAGSAPLFLIDVAAQSATRVYSALDDRQLNLSSATSTVHLLDAATGAVLGSAGVVRPIGLARDSSGTPAYLVDGFTLKRLSADGSSASVVSRALAKTPVDAAVITDPCAFEATATPPFLGPAGGSGSLTIPAPAGCPWSMDLSGAGGLTVTPPTAGTGPGTRAFTVPPTTAPRLLTLEIGRQSLLVEQTIPRMNVEFTGGTVQEPLTIGGWAFDQNAISDGTTASNTGVGAVHVWAYPASGAAPIFIDAATYGLNRPDIAAIYGANYALSGFRIVVGGLPSGAYTLVFFAYSTRSGTFNNAQPVNVTVQRPPALIVIDTPTAGTVKAPFTVAGWAVDQAASGGLPGIDAVHVWAYPSTGAPAVFVGQAAYGGSRPDVAAYLGSSFQNSGYGLTASLPPGDYTLVVFARSTATGQFTSQTVRITIQ